MVFTSHLTSGTRKSAWASLIMLGMNGIEVEVALENLILSKRLGVKIT
jgi:hypothetical protein